MVVALVLLYLFGGDYFVERPELRLGDEYAVDERPDLLSHDGLLILSDTPRPQLGEGLRQRLDALLTTPFVNNEAYYIERGLRFELIRSALAGGDAFLDHVDVGDDDFEVTDETRREIEREMQLLQTADVLVLQD